jgi:hypothetical protein
VGDYELAPDFVISVRARDGRFFTQATGQPELEIFAISESEFYLQDVEAPTVVPGRRHGRRDGPDPASGRAGDAGQEDPLGRSPSSAEKREQWFRMPKNQPNMLN